MANKSDVKTTFEVFRAIEPIYTGGEVSANADGTLLATTVDGDVQVVDIKTGKPLVRIDGDGETITNLALSPTGTHLAVCSRSLSMRLYALSSAGTKLSAELVRTLKPHTSPVVSSTIDSTGSLLVTGGADGVAKVWDIRAGYCSHTFHGHGGLVTAVEFFEGSSVGLSRKSSVGKKRKSRDGEDTEMIDAPSNTSLLLASGGEDGKIKIWDLNTKKAVATLDSHVSVVRSIKYSSKQKVLLSVSRDKTIIIWDSKTWQTRRIIPALEVIESGGFILDGRYCYAGGENGRLRIWDTETGREVTEKQEPGLETETIVAVVKVLAEDALMSVQQDQTMVMQSYALVKDLRPGSTLEPLPIIRRISGNHDEIIDMACVGSDKSLLALATNTESIKIISIAEESSDDPNPTFSTDVALLEGHEDIIICMDVDKSGHWLATGAKDNTARLWRLSPSESTYECFATFAGHAESLGAVALPSEAQTGAAAVKDPLNHPPSYLITGSQDKTIKKWDTSKLAVSRKQREPYSVTKAVYTRVAHEKDINAIDVSPNAPLFASASQDRTIKIWSVDDGSTAAVLKGHKRGVWSISFSPTGAAPLNLAEGGSSSSRGLICSGSGDRTVKVWSLATYTCLLTFEGHSNSVLKVMWLAPPGLSKGNENSHGQRQSRNQPVIVSASSDTLVKLWSPYASLDSDHLLATLDNHTDRIWSLASPQPAVDSSNSLTPPPPPYSFISGAADATLTFWRDITSETQQKSTAALTERIEQDQKLQNFIHARNYRESIILSLTLNHPGRLLKILSDVVSLPDAEKEPGSIMGVRAVDDVLASLSQPQLYLLLERVRDWNVNARTAPVAQRVLNVLFKKYPASTWTEMAKSRNLRARVHSDMDASAEGRKPDARKMMSMRDLFRALEVYTERHYKRMEELVDESYMIEYTLREMDGIAGTTVDGNVGVDALSGADQILLNGTGRKLIEGKMGNGDVTMD